MASDSSTCPSCGARVPPDADRCELCGTSVDPSPDAGNDDAEGPEREAPAAPDEEETSSPSASDPSPTSDAPSSVYCNQCGWENPGGAQYCSRCGSELQDLSGAEAPPGTRTVTADLPTGPAESEEEEASPTQENDAETAAMGQQVTLIVGTAVLLVVGFFFLSRWSQTVDWGDEGASPPATSQQQQPQPSGPSAGAAPQGSGGAASPAQSSADLESLVASEGASLSEPVTAQVDSLQSRAKNAGDSEQRQLQREHVAVLMKAGAPGRAALVQRELAEATGNTEDHRRTADLLYRWMRTLQQDGGRQQALRVAPHVAAAYEKVVEQRPDDLDARTRMGEAYLLTNNPMQGIEEINAVLEEDSTFVPARFQKGLALLQISRLEESLRQFEAVKRHANPDSAFYRQAERAIEVISEQTSAPDNPSAQGR